MTWHDVAYKNVQDAGRSRTVWLVLGFLTVAFVDSGREPKQS
jgi:hypothetical protein